MLRTDPAAALCDSSERRASSVAAPVLGNATFFFASHILSPEPRFIGAKDRNVHPSSTLAAGIQP